MEARILYKPHEGFNPEWVPKNATEHSAGWDLYCAETTKLEAYKPTFVATKFDIAIPDGTAMLVLPRSGNSKKGIIIPNSPGLIDADYRGHTMTIFTWIPHPDDSVVASRYEAHADPLTGQAVAKEVGRDRAFIEVKAGERMAQLVLIPYIKQQWVRVNELPPTTRGAGGFGSTGS